MLAYLSYFGAHWQLAVVTVLVVAAIGALAFFLKNWKAAVAAVAIAAAGFAYQGIEISGYHRKEVELIAEKLETANGRLKALSDLALKHAAQAQEDAVKIEELESKVENTPRNDNPCLDADAASRLRNIK